LETEYSLTPNFQRCLHDKLSTSSDLTEKNLLSKNSTTQILRLKITCVDRSLSGSHRHVWCVCNKCCSLHDGLSDAVYLHCQLREIPQDLPKWQNNDTSAVSCCLLTKSCTHLQTMCSLSLSLTHTCAYGLILAVLVKHFKPRTKIFWNKYILKNLAIHTYIHIHITVAYNNFYLQN